MIPNPWALNQDWGCAFLGSPVAVAGSERLEQAQTVMRELRAHGFLLAIDDFGTGYASLTYLESLPVDILTLDRVFISHMTGESRSDAIVRAIIPLAHALGLVVVAEGIEHQEQLDILEELGCDAIQGYLLGTPPGRRGVRRALGSRRCRTPPRSRLGGALSSEATPTSAPPRDFPYPQLILLNVFS